MDILKEMRVFEAQLPIDETNLNKELAQYSANYCRVLQIANFCEENFDKTEASTDMTIRAQATEAGEKVTEKVVEARVKLDPTYQEAFAARNAARALKEGFKMKGNMLIQLATNIREELKNLGHSVNADTSAYNEYFNN